MSRRASLQLAGASTVGGALAACSPGSSGTGERTIRLGYVSPQSGPLASFTGPGGPPVDMSPPIPSGRAARTAWRRLDRQTKAEILRRAAQGQGHPDPEVAAVAVGFARWELNYPRWVQVAIVLVLLLVAVFLDSLRPRPPIPIVTITLLVALALIWRSRRTSRAKLERMERANLAVLGGEATANDD